MSTVQHQRPRHAKPDPTTPDTQDDTPIIRAGGHLAKLGSILAQVFRSPETSLSITANAAGAATVTASTSRPWSAAVARNAVRHLEGALKAGGFTITRAATPRRATNAAGFSRIEVSVAPLDDLPERKNDIVMPADALNIAVNRARLSKPVIIGAFFFMSLTEAAKALSTSSSALGEKIRRGAEGYRFAEPHEVHALAADGAGCAAQDDHDAQDQPYDAAPVTAFDGSGLDQAAQAAHEAAQSRAEPRIQES